MILRLSDRRIRFEDFANGTDGYGETGERVAIKS